ncbi:DUF1217 domain-containing protein [Roseiterribacter gracilis]|uniref:Uncharacterized protein n=1 Tax=Roseiterribacter gracilis TaxID=2812848 RepID=A0A8S8X5Z5_9PROT|nr:hypothetical protein TMPK1_00800 [Rhodospirillales bacterium TMPK1]
MSSVSIATWQGLLANQQQQLTRSAQTPSVKDAVDYFTTKAPTITSIDQLMSDPKLLKTVLTTYGLESEAQYPARLRALLTQDPSNPQSLVNRLVDPRFSQIVKDLSFFNGPPAGFKDQAYIAKFTQTYETNVFEENLGAQDPALREAAYFIRNIGNVTSPFQILGDNVLRDVVQTALQLPSGFAGLDVDQQAAILTSRLNLKSLQNTIAQNADLFQSATDDQAQITDATNLSSSASTVVSNLSSSLTTLKSAYDALALRRDPSGANAAKIADQNNYVPQLTQVRGLLDAAKTRTSDLTSSIDALRQLVQSASGLSAADLATTKTQFDNTVARLKNNLDNATYLDPATGTPSNLLENAGFSLTITTSPGHSYSFQGTDLTSIKTALDSAQAQFDALNQGDVPAGTLASDLDGARASSVSNTDFLNQQQRTYNTLLENVDPTIGPAQQALVYRAASSAQDSLSRANQIAAKLTQLGAALDTGTGTLDANGLPINHNSLDESVQQLKADIQSLIKTSGGGTDNLLTGNGDYGSESGIALSIHGLDLVSQISDKLTNVNALSASNSLSGSVVVEQLQQSLDTLTKSLSNQANYVQQAATSAGFAVTVDTNQLAQGSQSVADSVSRATQIGSLLGQLQSLAQGAVTNGGDATLASQVSDLQNKISGLINTSGTDADNLLVGGGSQAYNFIGGTQLYVRKGDLNTSVAGAIAGIDLSTASGAKAAYDLITGTVLPSLADARTTITSDGETIDNARLTFDGRTAIDNQLILTTQGISEQVANATVTVKNTSQPIDNSAGTIDSETGELIKPTPDTTIQKNLLTSTSDTLLFLKSTPGTFDISGHGEFDTQVTRPLVAAVNNLFKTAGPPTAVLGAAINSLTDISIDLSGDMNTLKFNTANVTDLLAQKAKAETDAAVTPYQGTAATKQLLMQYLALVGDSTNAGTLSVADLINGTASTTNILNLLL